ncbi:30S ribosomal protein S20 [Candidatus Dependentiae bacterium]|nr:30S ribosomal protein S20 [Candidatus Dependentiae bacterium]MBU4387552.1 30S ribosomal protein S20 [Candidatus Dependentiae bacterium]MCG2756627.1 30S ribosomal protein S20 [Candidatus Dependentiae bacterium]
MANLKSSKKRAKTNEKKRNINLTRKSEIKTIIKKYSEAIAEKNLTAAKDLLNIAESKIARAAGKGLFKKNAAARKVSRLTQKLVAIQK